MSENFKNKAVRDLAWALNSNAMLLGTHVVDQDVLDDEYLKYLPQLLKLDKNPSPLIDYLAKNNTRRLGHYFEQLVFFWLNQSERYTITAKNLPVRTEKKETLGEIDVIVYDRERNIYEHWELAVKFYLAHHSEEKTTFIGPNANDYFHLKLEKLIHQQCKIFETEAGQKILDDYNINGLPSRLFVKGCMYYHPKQKYAANEPLHPDHNQSWWIHLNEANAFLSDDNQYALIHKNEWLSTPSLQDSLMSKKECLDLIHKLLSESPRSLQLARYKNRNLIDQGFVTKDNWPNLIL